MKEYAIPAGQREFTHLILPPPAQVLRGPDEPPDLSGVRRCITPRGEPICRCEYACALVWM